MKISRYDDELRKGVEGKAIQRRFYLKSCLRWKRHSCLSSKSQEGSGMSRSPGQGPEATHSCICLLNYSRGKEAKQFSRGVIRHDAEHLHEDK